MTRLAPLLPVLLLNAACSNGSSNLPRDIDDLGGKADDSTAAVTFTDVDEPLFSKALQAQICAAANAPDCNELAYTVKRIGESTLLLHADDSDPVTMQLDVLAEDTTNSVTYNAILRRQLGTDFRLHFSVEITSSLDPDHQFIRALAKDGGEFPDFFEWIAEDKVAEVAFADLPGDIATLFEDERADQEENLQQNFNGSVDFADEHGFLEILDGSGNVIGYILSLWDSIDHPLWDGSGATIYYDRLGNEVWSEAWSG